MAEGWGRPRVIQAKRNRPAANGTAPKNSVSTDSLPDAVESRPDRAALVAGVYVAVVEVRGEHIPPRYRRRTYWNLPSAQRAIDRARMDGLEASMVLCQLVPVGGASGE